MPAPAGTNPDPNPRPRAQTQTRIHAQQVGYPRVRGYFIPVAIFRWQQWQRFEFFGVLLMVAGGSHLLASSATTPSRGRARLMTSRSWEIAVGVLGMGGQNTRNPKTEPKKPEPEPEKPELEKPEP